MNQQDKSEVSKQIELEISKTQEIIIEYREASQPIAPENAIGRLSRMDAINNQSVTKAALSKAEEKLKGLKYLKGRLTDPDFGKCARCKSEIPLPRMLFMPQSPFCVHCAS